MSNPYGPPGGQPPPQWGQQPYGQPGQGMPPQGWGQPGLTQPVPGHQVQGSPPYGYGYPPQQQPPHAVPGPQQGFGHQQGFGGPGFTTPNGPKKRSPLPWILGGFTVLVVVVILVLGFVAPGFFVRTTFDAGAVQQGVQQILTDSYDIPGVESVTCPSGQAVEPGATFDCEATVEGSTLTVTVTVKDDDGTYEVGHPR